MCCCAVRVYGSKGIGGNDPITYFLARKVVKSEFFYRNSASCSCNTTICQIGEDTQMDFSTCNRFDTRSEPLTSSIDSICPHCIPHIINEMDDKKGSNRRR